MCVRVLGDKTRLDEDIRNRIAELEEATKNNDGLHFQIAINYGGRDEIIRAVKKLSAKVQSGEVSPETITADMLEDYLDTFQGILIVVSHDRYFLDRVVKRLFVYDGYGQIRQFEGSYTDYYLEYGTFANSVKSGSGSVKPAPASKGKPAADSSKSGAAEKDTAPKRAKNKFTFNEQREYDTIEDDIAACEETIDGLDREIAASTTDFTKLNHLMAEKENAELKLEHLMERYVYLTDLLESFKK